MHDVDLDPLPITCATGGAGEVASHARAAGSPLRSVNDTGVRAPIIIAVKGPDAAVHVRYADLVAGILTVPRSQEPREKRLGRVKRTAPVFGSCHGHVYRFPAKLAVAVGTELMDRGYRVRFGPFSSPDLKNWDAVDPVVRDLIGDPRFAGLGGLIPVGPGIDPPRIFFYLLWLFPRSRVVVATTRRDLRNWREYLTSALGRTLVTTVNDNRLWRGHRAVLVTTLRELDYCQPDDFDLVLVPDASPLCLHPLIENDTKRRFFCSPPTYPVLREWRVPAFGYLPRDPAELSASEELTLGSWFGRTLRPRAPVPDIHAPVVTAPQV